jgi:translation initiation factor 2B subunit (eIF-2B alpha/beta/delta family)
MKENNIPESFENAMNDLVVGRVVPLNTALNEPYKELDNIDSLKLHNHVLKVANDELDEENKRLKEDLELYKKVNVDLRKEIRMLEKLIELNMKDLWDIADQRDWYYEEYQKLKRKEELKQAAWRRK